MTSSDLRVIYVTAKQLRPYPVTRLWLLLFTLWNYVNYPVSLTPFTMWAIRILTAQ